MISVLNNHITMTDPAVLNDLPSPEEVLEDGEIDDEEVITKEVVEEAVSDSPLNREGSVVTHMSHADACRDNIVDEDDSDEDKKKIHRKRQRKRKKHRESKEKELKRRKKRKMHSNDDNAESAHKHGGSLSPHSRRHKKRKKHSRDRRDRDSTTPDSDESMEQYSMNYQDSLRSAFDTKTDAHSLSKMETAYNINNSSSVYYAATVGADDNQNDSNNYGSESESDFDAQLAEYQNYKTHGDSYSKDSGKYREKRKQKKSIEADVDLFGQKRAVEMYEEFMEYDENPKKLCKFFAEGKCLKGSDCSFSHDQSSHRNKFRTSKREMCKYYIAGHCHHGNQCTYMHGDYPCKYYHTGSSCYAGDNCRFSHDPPTEETRDIIESFKDILGNVDDTWEVNELKKQGIEVQPKPPPGVGLLPTPDVHPMTKTMSSLQAFGGGGSSIPSIFDINVAPTADLQKRIEEKAVREMREIDTACILLELSSVASLSMTDDSEGNAEAGMNQLPPAMYQPPFSRVSLNANGGSLLPTPVMLPDRNATAQQTQHDHESDEFYGSFYEGQHNMESGDNHRYGGQSKGIGKLDDVIKANDGFIRTDDSTPDEKQTKEAMIKAPVFLPATQKALFMRIHGKRATSDAGTRNGKRSNTENPNDWLYSSDEETSQDADSGVIKMDVDIPSSSEAPQTSSAAMESLLKMISKGGNPANVDTNLLSKVASVINMPSSTASSTYNPASSVSTYNPAQVKTSPHQSNIHHKDRTPSGLSSTSPGHAPKHRKPHPVRMRLPTQELTKEPVVIPLVAKQSSHPTMHSTHPDPRLTLSRLLGVKVTRFSANLPQFSKDLILPGAGKMVGLKVTLSSEENKVSKRDPRLGRHKDPRLQRSSDPRLKNRDILKSTITALTTDSKSSAPCKPSALLTKSSATIPSLPELDLNLAHINQQSTKENGDASSTIPSVAAPSYSLSNLKLPKLVKAPSASPQDPKQSVSPKRDAVMPPPTIAPYDPRYMASGSTKQSGSSDLLINTAPSNPRVLSGKSTILPAGAEMKKRTIQLPKLTPAPTYKPSYDAKGAKTEGDQRDF